MMQHVYVINAPRMTERKTPRSFVDMMVDYLAEKIAGAMDAGLGSIMFGRRRVPAMIAASMTAVSSRLDQMARPRPAVATDTPARFHREIVPQLDAAYNFARFLSRDADAAQ